MSTSFKEHLKNPKLIIVSAPSGAGKTSLCDRLLKDAHGKIVLSISTTTRPPRNYEIEGRHYYFTTREKFREMVDANEFAEWAEVHHHLYGTSKKTVSDTLAQGKCVLLDIDVQGAASLRQAYPGRCLSFFITTPNLDELRARLRKRGAESEEMIEIRIINARKEIEEAKKFDHIIVNDDFEKAYARMKEVINQSIPGVLNAQTESI